MPRYRFIVQGRGSLPDEIIGFFTTRWYRAETQLKAADLVLQAVRDDWATGEWASSGLDSLEVVKSWPIGFLETWRAPNKGNTFYKSLESEAEALEVEMEAARCPSRHLE